MSSYDQNLLDDAPKATRAQLQEGYNVDLLKQPPQRTSSVRNPPPQTSQPTPVSVPLMSGIAETGLGEKFDSPIHTAPGKSRTSFWRSRNGVIAVVIIILVVIGAVVGGAVGGTVKKNNAKAVLPSTTSTTTKPAGPSPPIAPPTSSPSSTTVATVTQGAAGPSGPTISPSTTSTTLLNFNRDGR